MAFDLLPSLKVGNMRCVVCVRVSRKWEYRGGTDDGPIQHVDLVLIDAKGNSIYAEIPASEVETKAPLIEENGIYVISRFRVSNAKRSFRPVASQVMIEFTFRTQVSAARDDMPGFPSITYKLTPIDDLKSRVGDTRDFIDIIGLLTEVSDPYTVRLPNKAAPTLTRHIILRDQNYSEIKVSLWGERATAFVVDEALTAPGARPIVVLFVGGLMKKYMDNYYLSANAAARWYFNPQIAEARHFYGGFQDQQVELRRVAAPAQVENTRTVPSQLELKTLLELNDKDPYDFVIDGYRCTVTIARLVPNASWWFASCNRCSKSCAADGAGYRCNACSSTSFRFKYKICFIALDGTDEAEMICFGDVARQLVGKPVQQLLRTSTSANTVPADITKIVSRRFTFAVTLTQQSYYKPGNTYQVTSIVTAHGQHEPAPPVDPNGGGAGSGGGVEGAAGDMVHGSLPSADAGELAPVPLSPTKGEHSAALVNTTPPASPVVKVTPSIKSQIGDKAGEGERSTTRRKLMFDSCDDKAGYTSDDLPEKEDLANTVATTVLEKTSLSLLQNVPPTVKGGEKKRSRGTRSTPQQSG